MVVMTTYHSKSTLYEHVQLTTLTIEGLYVLGLKHLHRGWGRGMEVRGRGTGRVTQRWKQPRVCFSNVVGDVLSQHTFSFWCPLSVVSLSTCVGGVSDRSAHSHMTLT